jgi:hypothetical protein
MDRLRNSSRGRPRALSADAERRVSAFLRGFGIDDEPASKELARRLGRLAPAGSASALDAAAGLWFADLLGLPESEGAKALAAGRVAWLAVHAGKRWPSALLADAVPAALAEALRRGLPALPPAGLADAMPAADLTRARLRHLVTRPARLRTRTA